MLGAKKVNTFHFHTARELRDWLNLWDDRKLDVIHTENSESEVLTVAYMDNDMEDGSHTYDLKFS